MNIIVQKYGGTSVENKEKLEKVCNRIIEYKENGYELVVVVSAQGKTTDTLISKAREYSKNPDLKSLDILLATGEMQTVSLLAMMLEDKGYETKALTASMAGIITTSDFGYAKIINVSPVITQNALKEGKIVIVTGFQGIDRYGNITTLGRGGSDLSAVAIASSLNAEKCEIYTDVDGVLTSDPKIIDTPILLDNISYDEMLEAASNGAKVLHNRCVSFAKRNNLNVEVKNSSTSNRGTSVKVDNLNENHEVRIITKKDNLSKISIISDMISETKNIFSIAFSTADKLNIPIEMVSISEVALNIVVKEEYSDLYITNLHKVLFDEKKR